MAPKTLLLAPLFLLSTAVSATGDLHGQAILFNENARATNQSLLWGAYRPGLYVGVKPRLPKSLNIGALWSRVDDYKYPSQNFRYTCEQGDDMEGYNWEEYDPRTGGRQVIKDKGNSIDITTEFVKVEGGDHGGSWGIRVKGVPRADAPKDIATTFIFYASLEGEGHVQLKEGVVRDLKGLEGTVTLTGNTPELGDFQLDITEGPETNQYPETPEHEAIDTRLDRTLYRAAAVPEKNIWRAKQLLFFYLQEKLNELTKKFTKETMPPPEWSFTIQPNVEKDANMHIVQKVFKGAFEFDVLFSSGSAQAPMTSEALTKRIPQVEADFAYNFEKNFKLDTPFDQPKYKKFARALLGNMLGGIGHFAGETLVDRSYDEAYDEVDENFWDDASEALKNNRGTFEGPFELFTTTPSRSFFPRGFYWDEGFHQLLVADWDTDLSIESLKSWLGRMDENGWIAREQILGEEARAKVPEEFQTQFPHHANPPTLFLLIEEYLNKLEAYHKPGKMHHAGGDQVVLDSSVVTDSRNSYVENSELALHFLNQIYPALRKHYKWFLKTQIADLKTYTRESDVPITKYSFRWRGRTPNHCLASGLDDYPRAQPPHPGELHVDLASWMVLLTRSMRRLADKTSNTDDSMEYRDLERQIVRNLNALHWSEKDKMYCDSTIDEYEESIFVCHPGYVSLFPLLVGGIVQPDDKKLPHLLDLIESEDHLWTPYGLRSLSPQDEFYGKDENYWRGPIWININYLAVVRLRSLAKIPGPEQKRIREIYRKLRINLVENIYKNWEETGFVWEQYNPEDGRGQRSKPFNGWSALALKMMGMEEETCLVCLEGDFVKEPEFEPWMELQ
ncbi:mannosyl-oligosaccharide glucosidase [Ascobolus immersus RN42]|uniref:Mannosyl-oligosaccharide glucosidase n=1 Tax=Ascobolus immersus RN42 TaxID=1160509 RepID=A0A3N4HY11_ASCIM|nr:mannosyl-oligosaccharide glucosidase [Ascobolus immersus RN42]